MTALTRGEGRPFLAFCAALLALAGCDIGAKDDDTTAAPGPSPSVAAEAVVDSAHPMAVLIQRFQESSGPRPDSLTGGSKSREELVRRYVAALASADTAELRSMAISRTEYAHLVFPVSAMAKPPYELNPGVAWLMLELESEKGVVRALAFGRANPPTYVDHQCDGSPVTEGAVRRWRECAVRVRTPSGGVQSVDLFGEIVELDGRYKVLSFANTL